MYSNTALFAQELQVSFHHLNQEDGLSYAENYLFFQDKQGFTWISTKEGLNRFDGKTIVKYVNDPQNQYSIAENQITSPCFQDESGDLWFTSFSYVQCYRAKSGYFESWALPDATIKYYNAFHLDVNGQLWLRIGSEKDRFLYLFDIKKQSFAKKIPMEGNLASLVYDQNGAVAHLVETELPTRGGMVFRSVLDEKSIYVDFQKMANGEKRRFLSPTRDVFIEGDSMIWVGVYGGIGVFYPKTGKNWVEVDLLPSVGINEDIGWVNGIVPLNSKELLVSCGIGLLVFDKEKRAFSQLINRVNNDPYSLNSRVPIQKIFLTKDGNLWMSREKMGVSFAHLSKRKLYTTPKLAGSIILTVFEDEKRNIWCSSQDSGILVFNQNRVLQQEHKFFKNFLYPNERPNLPPLDNLFQDPIGQIWGINGNTLLLFNAQKKEFEFRLAYLLSVPSTNADRINACIKLNNGRQLVAMGNAAFYLSTHIEQVSLLPWFDLNPYHLQVITAIFQDKSGHFFIADETERLLVFKETSNGLELLKEFNNKGICNRFLETNDGTIFAATSRGLLRIVSATWQMHLLNEANDGLPNDFFSNVLSDKNGLLWLSGTNGLLRYDLSKKQFHRFSRADGLASVGASDGSFISDVSGYFWLGGNNGLNVFQPEQVTLLNTQPPVQITQIYVNDQPIAEKDLNLNLSQSLSFGYKNNTLTFQFAVLDYSDPSANQFFYRLKGYDEAWVSNGNKNMVRYPNLPPGNYTFEVKATNSDGVLHEKACSIGIKISPPFYNTWWFYLLCTLAAASVVYGWFWYRLQQALKIERLRVQISSDLHDDVGTMLAGLAMQSESLELSATEKDKGKLRRISEISRNAMAHMRDTVWAIDARKDKMENLLDRMREHAEESLTPKDIRFDITLENISLKQSLSTEIRQNLYLLYKEAVTNAAKHTNGDTVLVHLKKSPSGFEMSIHDNGQVAEKNYKTTGLGTSNMQMRAQKMGGTLEVSRENGFNVVLRMPSF